VKDDPEAIVLPEKNSGQADQSGGDQYGEKAYPGVGQSADGIFGGIKEKHKTDDQKK
jgi:hypothetical protein